MKTNNLCKLWLLFGSLLTSVSGFAAQVLVSGTDFDVSAAKQSSSWAALSDVKYTGLITPTVSTVLSTPADLDYEYSTATADEGKAISSHFQTGKDYAITSNPIRLDSIDYIDDKTNDWGMVFSPQNYSANTTVLSYNVAGLKAASTAKVVIYYRSVIDPDNNVSSCGNGSRAQFKVALNADQYNQTQGNDVSQVAMGESGTYTNSAVAVASDGSLQININMVSSYSSDCHAFEITGIEVYGEIDPVAYSIDGNSICMGEIATLNLKGTFNGATFQWYKDGTAIAGETNQKLSYQSSTTAEGSNAFMCKVTYGGESFSSNEVDITFEKCCEITNAAGATVPASRKVIFKEDFGEFDLSDATGSTYKVWDYSDISNPKQVTKTTTTPFRYALDEGPLGCTYNGAAGPLIDGQYCVAGVITGYNAFKGYAGAQLAWANRVGGLKEPVDPSYDHSGELQGCALFINVTPNTGGQDIYKRTLTNLCQNRQLFYECYFTVFTNSAAGTYNPCDITMKMTEVGNETNTSSVKGTATIEAEGGTGTWVKLSGQIFLASNDQVLLEIINNSNVSENGNDLVLDDIIIKACAAPSIQAYYDLSTLDADTVTCDGQEPIMVYAKPSGMLDDYFGGTTRYQYQYTTTPSVKTSWKNIGSLTTEKTLDVSSCPLFSGNQLETGDILYFRVIAGGLATMTGMTESEFNADDPCASYTISDSIPCVIDCPTCTEPLDPVISSSVKAVSGTVSLCKGESTTLSSNDVIPAEATWASSAFTGYTLQWLKDDVAQNTLDTVGSKTVSTAKVNTITNPGVTVAETHTWTLKVYDNLYPTESKCIKTATIKVTFLPAPATVPVALEFCAGAPKATDVLPTTTEGTITVYDDLKGTTDITKTLDLTTLVAGTYNYGYTVTGTQGCISDTATFDVTVDSLPKYIVDPIAAFCAGKSETESLPVADADKKYTIAWTPTTIDLNTLEGSTTPYAYTYVVTDATTGCFSAAQDYTVTVNPAATVKLALDSTCGKTTATVTVTPTGATQKWSVEGTAITAKTEFTSADAQGELKVVASAEGYCADSATANLSVQAVPSAPTAKDVTYIKSQQASFVDVQKVSGGPAATYNETTNPNCELVFSQDGVTWTTTAPTPTVKDATDPAEETQTWYVGVRNKTTLCAGTLDTFVIHIYGAPVPNVRDTAYCVGTTAAAIASQVTVNNIVQGTYTLNFYNSNGQAVGTATEGTTVPPTSAEGVVIYYASQTGEGGESEKVKFLVNVYAVKEPVVNTATYDYCLGTEATALTAIENKRETNNQMSDGLLWSTDGKTYTATAPVPSTAATGTATYYVKQSYTIPTSKEVCDGTPVEITVNVEETTDPTGTFSVGYVLADAEATGSFSDILTQDATSVDIEEGYTYEYCKSDATGTEGTWSTTVPTPASYTAAQLNGQSVNEYYLVRRTSTTGAKCVSKSKLITITISDSPMPTTTPLAYCEGETVADLSTAVAISPATGKTAADYTLLWYGTTKPSTTAEYAAGSTTVSTAPAATVTSPSEKNVLTYYVAEKDNATGAIGTASALVITIYPKPVQTITDPAAVCATAVDLSAAVKTTSAVTPTLAYFSDAAGTTAITASVTESGTYYAQSSYATPSATITGSVCASTVDPIKVTVDQLELQKVADAQTCPNTEAVLSAKITANTTDATFAWSAQTGTDAKSDAQTVADGAASSTFTTVALAGDPGDTYLYNLTVTAGTCTASQKGIIITIGDGPVVGTLTLAEADNATAPKVYTSTRDNSADPFYTCGGSITATAAFTMDAGTDYTWSNGTTGATATLTEPGTYTITYSNKCATSVTFVVEDASIKANKLTLTSTALTTEGDYIAVCEKTPVAVTLSYTSGQTATIAWTKDGAATTLAAGTALSLPAATADQSGVYSYTITSKGCTVTGDTTIKVKPYIQFAPENTEYVVARTKSLTIVNNITVPTAATPATIEWTENGTSVATDKDYTLTVDGSHQFDIAMSDPDYCPASASVTVKADALLSLKATIDAKMCKGDKGVYLKIDTTGTGAFVYPAKAKLTVTQTVDGSSKTLTGWVLSNDTLLLEVSPTQDATYTVDFTYREGEGTDFEQTAQATASITVLQPIEITVPTGLSVCSGDELEVALTSVTPTGVIVNWTADATISGTTDNTESITVTPEYDETTGRNHNSYKYYHLTAQYEGCADKLDSVRVKVNEPITGTLPTDTTICEGTSLRVDASNYAAATYSWTTPAIGNPLSQSQTLSVTPDATAEYTVSMTRDNCKAEATITVTVNSNPLITSVDSLSYRNVEIMVDESHGTAPYYYSVDNGTADLNAEKDSLKFGNHTAYVHDAYNCVTSFDFTLKAPSLNVPDYFSPNGDGSNDVWKIPSVQDVYPAAEITIYDRWGKKLVEYKGAEGGWDGTYDGNDMPSTDYWYEIHIREIDKIYTGHFTLLRR